MIETRVKNGRTKSIQILKSLGTIDRKCYEHAMRCFVLYSIYLNIVIVIDTNINVMKKKSIKIACQQKVGQVYGVTINFVYSCFGQVSSCKYSSYNRVICNDKTFKMY